MAVVLVALAAMALPSGRIATSFSAGADSVKTDTDTTKQEAVVPQSSVIDEVIWVVGDEPILVGCGGDAYAGPCRGYQLWQ